MPRDIIDKRAYNWAWNVQINELEKYMYIPQNMHTFGMGDTGNIQTFQINPIKDYMELNSIEQVAVHLQIENCEFESNLGHRSFVKIDHKIFSMAILPTMLIQEGHTGLCSLVVKSTASSSLGLSPLWFKPCLGHKWESKVLLIEGQVVFSWVLQVFAHPQGMIGSMSVKYSWEGCKTQIQQQQKNQKNQEGQWK